MNVSIDRNLVHFRKNKLSGIRPDNSKCPARYRIVQLCDYPAGYYIRCTPSYFVHLAFQLFSTSAGEKYVLAGYGQWKGKDLHWVVPEKIHSPEKISAVRRGRGEKIVSDNSKCIRTSEGGRGVNFLFPLCGWYGCFLE